MTRLLPLAALGLLALSAAAGASEPNAYACDAMQMLELQRNAAIHDKDMDALRRIYSADFRGITSGGAFVDREAILKLFAGNDPSKVTVSSQILSCRPLGTVLEVIGRLTLRDKDSDTLVSDAYYLHLFRYADGRWQLTGGMSTPATKS